VLLPIIRRDHGVAASLRLHVRMADPNGSARRREPGHHTARYVEHSSTASQGYASEYRNVDLKSTANVTSLQWLDTVSSLTLVRPPKYLRLLKRLLGERGGYWPAVGDSDGLHSLRMDLLTGCPDEAMLALAEITNLAYWKATEQRNGTLSFRELVRRGDDIEQRLRQHHSNAAANLGDVDQAPLHPNLVQTATTEPRIAPFPSEEARRLVAKVFCEAAVLSLHTVLSNANPGTYLTTCIIVHQKV
jgi:hypothetical protein